MANNWPVVARDNEYATIQSALVDVQGVCGIVLVGDAGVGKTTLARLVTQALPVRVQWVAGTEAEYKTIARTFLSVFPETTVWGDGSLLVGSVEPLRLRRSDFDAKLKVAGRAGGMREMGAPTFEALQATFVAGPRELAAFVGDGPVLTDDRPLTEYFLSLPRNRGIDTSGLKGDVRPYVDPIDN